MITLVEEAETGSQMFKQYVLNFAYMAGISEKAEIEFKKLIDSSESERKEALVRIRELEQSGYQ